MQPQNILRIIYPIEWKLLIPIVGKTNIKKNKRRQQEYKNITWKSEKKPRMLSNDNQRILIYENCYNTYANLNRLTTLIHPNSPKKIFNLFLTTLYHKSIRERNESYINIACF